MYAAKKLLEGQGSTLLEGRQTGLDYDVSSLCRGGVQLDARRHRDADAILLIGTNPRWEAPLVNTRLRKAVAARARRCSASGRRSTSPIRSPASATICRCSASCRAVTEAFAAASGRR
jgi:NADH dehydrogenase/NADH:ubiquinone oxidoreductase subunit G